MIARWLMLLMMAVLVGSVADAQSEEPAPEEAVEETTEQAEEETALPGLDELLGIDGDGAEDVDEDVDEDALDTNKAELERELTDEELGEQFVQAIRQMEAAADRLQRGGDAGVATQRLQDEIMIKLDLLIKNSQDQQGGGGSSSSSSSEPSGEPPSSSPQQGGQQEQQGGGGDAASGAAGAGDPAYNEGKNELIEAVGTGWGALPERVRETLLEGLNDVFSSRYKEQTEAYYRRLAEEGASE